MQFKLNLHFQNANAGILLRSYTNTNGVALQRSGWVDNVVLISSAFVAVGRVEFERLQLPTCPRDVSPFVHPESFYDFLLRRFTP